MVTHTTLLATNTNMFRALRTGQWAFAGNRKLKIYGLLSCTSGKRMHIKNRVFLSLHRKLNKGAIAPASAA